jgi:hypothetical protein
MSPIASAQLQEESISGGSFEQLETFNPLVL